VALNDAPHNSKANAVSLELLRPLQALENPEQLIDIFPVKAGSLVSHEYFVLGAARLTADFDTGIRSHVGVLDYVGQRIDQNLAQQQVFVPPPSCLPADREFGSSGIVVFALYGFRRRRQSLASANGNPFLQNRESGFDHGFQQIQAMLLRRVIRDEQA
jgi:hypothetical protein